MVEQLKDAVLTAEEAEIYDRQIRLWGVEAQQRLRRARILMVGLSSLGNEVTKNVLLAGVRHMTLLDHVQVTEEDCKTQFLTPYDAVGQNRAKSCLNSCKNLNPMVDIVADIGPIEDKPEEFLKNFDVVCVTNSNSDVQEKVNEICRRLGIKFLSGNVFGYYGYMFSDFGNHKYMEEQPKKLSKEESEKLSPSSSKKSKKEAIETEMVEKMSSFCSFKDAMSVPVFAGKNIRQAKEVSKAYLIMKVLLQYERKYGYFPVNVHSQQDLEKLLDVRSEVFETLQIDNELLPEDFTSHCVGSLYPVAAIVGGIMAQEVIKAVSGKDAPHNNFFFYDGNSTSGVVQKINPEIKSKTISEERPKVKDVVEEIVL